MRSNLLMFSFAALMLFAMLLVIVFGEQGVRDLSRLRVEHQALAAKNQVTFEENVRLYRQIERLKTDNLFVEMTARKELGLVGETEFILKSAEKKR